MKRLLAVMAVLAAVMLGGCATAKKMTDENGREMYSIDCSGTALSIADCYEKAGQLCPRGYYEKGSQTEGSVTYAGAMGFLPVTKRVLMVGCK